MSGAHWAIAASIATAATHATMRWVDLHPFLVAFWRNLFCLILIVPLIATAQPWRCNRGAFPRHVLRGLINTAAMVLLIMGLIRIPFAEATALTFAAPAFIVIGGIIFLKERPHGGHMLAALFGIIGVLIVAPPGQGLADWGAAYILISAALFAAAALVSRNQTKFANNQSILFYLYLMLTIFCAPLTFSQWVWPSSDAFLTLFIVACFSIAAHWAATIAVRLAEASSIAVFDYLRLVWGALIGVAIFSETLPIQTVAGMLVISAAAVIPSIYARHRMQ